MLDENEEGVLHLPRRELEAADDLMQRQRAVAQEAAAHLLRKGIGRAGVRATHSRAGACGRSASMRGTTGRGGGVEGTEAGLRIRGDRSGRR